MTEINNYNCNYNYNYATGLEHDWARVRGGGLHKRVGQSLFSTWPPFLCEGDVQHFIYTELDVADSY